MDKIDEPRFIKLSVHSLMNARSLELNALVDTGSSSCGIPRSVVHSLRLKPTGMVKVSTPAGIHTTPIYFIDITFEAETFRCQAIEVTDSTPFLVGWDIIQRSSILLSISARIPGHIVRFLTALPSIKSQLVLILGEDTAHLDRLKAIQTILQIRGFAGLIPKEHTDIPIQSIEEKVNMLGSLSRFIVCDNSFPSGHIDELKICSLNRFVTAIIQEKGKGATWMQTDYPLDFNFIKVFKYSSIRYIPDTVDRAISWAQKKVEKRNRYFGKLYSWRTP